jgi:hypothetical protein
MSPERYASKAVDAAILSTPVKFQTAVELTAKSRFMKSAMSEEVGTIFSNNKCVKINYS